MNARRIATALAVLLAACGGAASQDRVFTRIDPPMTAGADVGLVDGTGDARSLADMLDGKPAIVHFWATWCAPCRAELPDLAAYADTLADAGLRDRLVVIAVEPSPRGKIDTFLDGLGLSGFATLQDRANASGAAFGLFGMPATLLLDGNGAITARHSGPLGWNDEAVRAELRAHMGG